MFSRTWTHMKYRPTGRPLRSRPRRISTIAVRGRRPCEPDDRGSVRSPLGVDGVASPVRATSASARRRPASVAPARSRLRVPGGCRRSAACGPAPARPPRPTPGPRASVRGARSGSGVAPSAAGAPRRLLRLASPLPAAVDRGAACDWRPEAAHSPGSPLPTSLSSMVVPSRVPTRGARERRPALPTSSCRSTSFSIHSSNRPAVGERLAPRGSSPSLPLDDVRFDPRPASGHGVVQS